MYEAITLSTYLLFGLSVFAFLGSVGLFFMLASQPEQKRKLAIVGELNDQFGGDWYYNAAHGRYEDTMTDRQFRLISGVYGAHR